MTTGNGRASFFVRVADGPEDTWRVRHVELVEAIGEPYTLSLELVATSEGEDPLGWPGAELELVIRREGMSRSVRAIVAAVDLRGATADGRMRVAIRAVPALALLGMRIDSRIFQEQGAHLIAGDVLGSALAGWGRAYVGRFSHDHETRDYCVQYRESDLDFARRLMEEEGLFSIFEQPDDGPERVVVLDDMRSLPELETSDGAAELRLAPDPHDLAGREAVHAFAWRPSLRPTGVVVLDFDAMQSAATIVHERHGDAAPERALEHYLHASRRWSIDDGARQAGHALDALRQRVATGTGRSNAIRMTAGSVFTLTGYPPLPDVQLLVTRVVHTGDCPDVDRFDTGSAGPAYVNRFECVRVDAPFRLERTHARPCTKGPETAIVTGPDDEEIHVDEHGRIKVAMHWDRSGRRDDTSSCWLRVSQSWAGSGWGAVVLPRIGMEVVIDFLGGDPDRPFVSGCMYNGANRPPNALPDGKTKTTFRTSSSPGGDGFNELTFEDRAGGEQVFLHAQRDLVEKVKRDETSSVGNDRAASVGRHESLSVGGDQHVTVDGNQTIAVNGGGKTGTKGTTAEIKGSFEVRVTEPGHVLIDAASSITLRCGASSITIDPMSIKVSAGAGTFATFDVAAMVAAAGGATATVSDAVALRSAAGGAMSLDGAVKANSAIGSTLVLDDTITATSSGAAKLTLDADVALAGGTITAEAGMGSALVLNEEAALTGFVTATCSAGGAAGGRIELDGTGVGLQGSKIGLAAAALAEVAGKLVKIN